MRGARGRALLLIVFTISLPVHAQLLKDLQRAVTNEAKALNTKENRDKFISAGFKAMEKARAEFDSTDFDYAILVSDNSGLLDIKEKGENTARITSLGSYTYSQSKGSQTTDAENARFYREWGEIFYASQKFVTAENSFSLAKISYENAGMREDIGYMKTIANQGLLYATMGRFTQAEEFTSEALRLRKGKFGNNHPDVAALLNNYGLLKHYLAQC